MPDTGSISDSLRNKLTEQLKRDEGIRLKPYTDSVGKLTVGIGRNLVDKGLSLGEAEHLLDNDVREAWLLLEREIPWICTLDEARQGVLLNMAFNLGIGGLLTFKNTLLHIRYGRWKEAAEGILDSKYAKQVGQRAVRLAKQMETGEWQ